MYEPKREPWAHQAEALKKMRGQTVFALLMAMRTGKTKTLLDDWGWMESEGLSDSLLVIAPGGVYQTWRRAIEDDLPDVLASRMKVLVWKAGGGIAQDREIASLLLHKGPKALLINVEALSSVLRARELCTRFVEAGRTTIAIDESTIIKNSKAKRTKFVAKLGKAARFRRIMSGLPNPRSPLDLYSQFDFLDWRIFGHRSFYSFQNRYAIRRRMRMGGREFLQVVGYQNEEELRDKMIPYSYRKRLEDVYDLPPKMYSVREVTLTTQQKRIYSDLKKYATSMIEKEKFVTATLVITQMLRMHQVLCGHVVDEEGNSHRVEENRTKELLSILEEYDGKAIVWCSYDFDVHNVSEKIRSEYGPESVSRFWGGNRQTREEEERRFLNDPGCRFMVATAAAGGRGRTWTVADLIIYYSNTYDLEHRSQSEERGQGVGKTNSVAYIDLVVPGTVDEKIAEALKAKQNLATLVLGDKDKWREFI